MNDFEDFQAKVDRLKAETDREIEADRRRRFNPLGFHRDPQRATGNYVRDLLVGGFMFLCAALAIGGAVIYGLFFM